ncbi:AMP-binding protein [Streptosporangium lutulentum]
MTALYEEPDQLALPSSPDLPTAVGPRSPGPAERHEHRLSPDRWEALAEAARVHGARPQALLVAAFAEVLRGWSKSPHFTLAYRSPGTGLVPVVASRTDDRFGVRAAKLDQAIARAVAGAAPFTETGGPPVVVGALEAGQVPEPALLDLGFREENGGLYLRWEAEGTAFPRGLCASMSGALVALLERLTTEEAAWRETRPDVVPEADRAILDEVNATDGPVPDTLLHEIVIARAAERPDAEAVVDGRRRLTYGELSSYAHRIGRRLRRDRVRANDLVAIVMEKGWEQYAAVYGVLTSGAAYLPIDATVPPERLAHLIERGHVRHVLTQSRLAERLTWPDGVVLHRVDEEFETGDDGPLPPSSARPTSPTSSSPPGRRASPRA